jgi:hypothetical protein
MSAITTLHKHLGIPPKEPLTYRMRYVSLEIRSVPAGTLLMFRAPENVCLTSKDRNLVWWALDAEARRRFGRRRSERRFERRQRILGCLVASKTQ